MILSLVLDKSFSLEVPLIAPVIACAAVIVLTPFFDENSHYRFGRK